MKWVVVLGGWYFGFEDEQDALDFAWEHQDLGAKCWPLWQPNERDMISGQPALECAKRAAARA